jgi:rhodanese-related sulfurtransferase
MSTISTQQLKSILDNPAQENTIVLDVRTEAEHNNEKISRKIKNIPDSQILNKVEELKKYDKIYIHCQSGNRSSKVVEILKQNGFENVYNVDGGIIDWKAQGFGTISNGKLPIIRQVFIVASALILVGTLGSFWNPSLIWLSIAIGCGLMFSGVTGNCMMANILARMPWNK